MTNAMCVVEIGVVSTEVIRIRKAIMDMITTTWIVFQSISITELIN